MGEIPTYTVSQITSLIKSTLETQIPVLWVEGEVSNFNLNRSGHAYFSLKDENALLNCVIWRGTLSRMRFFPENGMHILARGRITVYEKGGRYQLIVEEIQPAGKGALFLQFLALKEKLKKKGYFAPERKKKIPPFPTRIGIVTSSTGAAIRDIINISRRRNPFIHLILYPAQVQGEEAATSIIAGIEYFNQRKDIDLIIIGRGGGSIEDLWAFNEEKLAEAIYHSRLPIISAVGHETDFTISDFVADVRAPTPSAAAEIAVPEASQILTYLEEAKSRLKNSLLRNLKLYQERVNALKSRPCFQFPLQLVQSRWQYLDQLRIQFLNLGEKKLTTLKNQLQLLHHKLELAAPHNILKRGFSIVRKKDTDEVISSLKQIQKDVTTLTYCQDGCYQSTINEVLPEDILKRKP